MKTRFNFIDPGAIIGVVVALIVLGVGVFAFFVTLTQITPKAAISYDAASNYTNITRYMYDNVSITGTNVFNIVGIVMIIGSIMAIVGLVYNYVK